MVKTIVAGSKQFVMGKEQELQTVREEWHSRWDKGHENKINDKRDHGVRSKRDAHQRVRTHRSVGSGLWRIVTQLRRLGHLLSCFTDG